MYHKSDNHQSQQSKQMIYDALMRLMARHSFADITVTQICQEAQVVRQTFYRNFDTKNDILAYYLDNMVHQYVLDFYKKADSATMELLHFFQFVLQHREFLQQLKKNSMNYLLDDILTQRISEFIYVPDISAAINAPGMEEYVLRFLSSTVYSVVALWIAHSFEETPEQLASLTWRFMSGLGNDLDYHHYGQGKDGDMIP